jgi:hypothetical protein
LPQAVALAAERSVVEIKTDAPESWAYPRRIAMLLGLGEERVQIRQADPAR